MAVGSCRKGWIAAPMPEKAEKQERYIKECKDI
jgi:hypothetical protein